MSILLTRIVRRICVLTALCLSLIPASAEISTDKIVVAAKAFLATLDEKGRQTVLFAFDDEKQRQLWSNFPTGIVQRNGIDLKDMNAIQRKAAMALVSSALSPKGFEKVQQIMEGDEVLKKDEGNRPRRGPGGGNGPRGDNAGNRPPFGNGGPPPGNGGNGPQFGNRGGGGGGLLFGKDLYYISLLGKPSEKTPWILQFGGHHLALNITIAGERGILTPSLTGAQPALYTVDGKTVRPLAGESDKAVALLNSLDESQRKQVILGYRLADLVLGPGQDGKTIQPEGLKASAMNDKQRGMLLDIVSEWTGIIHESAAAARMAEIKAGLADTWFAWSGPIDVVAGSNIKAYYRIQGPKLVIEYAPQTLGGDPTLHVHTMYRDPTNDYGKGIAAN